jgi:hypothetical protein
MGGVFHLVSECSSFEGKEFDALGAGALLRFNKQNHPFLLKKIFQAFFTPKIFFI